MQHLNHENLDETSNHLKNLCCEQLNIYNLNTSQSVDLFNVIKKYQ